MTARLELIPLLGFPLVEPGDDLVQLFIDALQDNALSVQEGGVLVVRQAICRGVAAPPKSGHEREIPIAATLRPVLVEALTR